MRITITYKNKKLEVIDIVEYDLDIYCYGLADRLVKTLSKIESLLNVDDIHENETYQRIRHTLLDISGEIKRLPSNLTLEPGQRIIWEDELPQLEPDTEPESVEKPQKVTLNLIQRMFGKVGD